MAHTVAIIGLGKIAEDQHAPVIGKNADFELAAVVSQRGLTVPGVPGFRKPAELFAAQPDLEAVAVCTPPKARFAVAREALDAGKHVLLEKPPAATMAELEALVAHAERRGRLLFATWHSQFNPAVDEARRLLANETLKSLHVEWKEDVRRWHPGQDWVWEPGGFGVFDPGINAFSIVTKIAPQPIFATEAELFFPQNRDTPIAAKIRFSDGGDAAITADLDWLQTGPQSWNITIETESGRRLALTEGGAKLAVDGELVKAEPALEYERIYERFAELLDSGESDVDAAPLRLVSDCFLVGRRQTAPSFDW